MTLKTEVTYDGEGNISMTQVVDRSAREQIHELQEEAAHTCGQFRQWMHDYRRRLSALTGPLYKEVIINRLLDGNAKGGFTMTSPDTAIGMFHAAGYDAFDKLEAGQDMLGLHLRQAEYFARVLEMLDEKAVKS
ncbi:hypothetical protein LJC15_01025 [Desulfovibrio sp. OttesenSCG-928-G11]|nr:hypothetical protein [Desulfovibrio sp. OttesenSCG-928-G11]